MHIYLLFNCIKCDLKNIVVVKTYKLQRFDGDSTKCNAHQISNVSICSELGK